MKHCKFCHEVLEKDEYHYYVMSFSNGFCEPMHIDDEAKAIFIYRPPENNEQLSQIISNDTWRRNLKDDDDKETC